MDQRLEKYFDENLRDVARDPQGLRSYVAERERTLERAVEPRERVRLLGEIGVHQRTLGDLNRAEESLRQALRLVHENGLGIKLEIQQKIRLGHVLQWQRAFKASDALFAEVIATCRSHPDAGLYLDFALQHAGKNFFDQRRLNEALVFFEEAMALRLKRQAPPDQIDSTVRAIERTKSLLGRV